MYKPEIDGLRALSIISVVTCHLDFAWARVGYLGVDVFFVISGFLIVGGIVDEVHAGESKAKLHFNFRSFYFRRVRRIIPVALSVQLFVLLYSYFTNNSLAFKSITQDFKWSTIFLANFHFAQKETNYFQAGLSPSPLLHTWSLSIEEQFYVLFPIILLLLLILFARVCANFSWKTPLRSQVLTLLFSLSLISFLYDLHIMNFDPIGGYYSSMARFWEITLGGIVYIFYSSRNSTKKLRYISIVATISLCLLFIVLWNMENLAVLKQLGVVIPVSVYLLFMANLNKISWFLKLKSLTFLGKISYSVYLWHWPIFIWVREYAFSRVIEIFVSLSVTVVLSILTWRFVETPFRKILVPKKWT